MHAVEITNFLDEKISELIKDRLPEEPGYPSGESQYASFIMPRDEMNHHDKSPKWSTNGRSNGSYEGADHKSKHDRAGSSSKSSPASKPQGTNESGLKDTLSPPKLGINGLPSLLSPSLPPQFCMDNPPLIPQPLSPTLPGAFESSHKSSSPASSALSTARVGQKRKRDDSALLPSDDKTPSDPPPSKIARKSPPRPLASTTPKKSVSLNEYKKRKNTSASLNGPLTPTLPKTQPAYVDSPRQQHDKPDSQRTQAKDENAQAKAFADKSQQYLARGTTLKREADKLSRSDQTVAAVTATHAILYFMSAFACDDQSRKLRGKLQLHDNWKSTSEFIVWVINLQKDNNEIELEGLWYLILAHAINGSHQLHAICHQRLYESELRFLRSCQKSFERQRAKDDKRQIEPDEQFWKVWNESQTHYSTISKAWRVGQGKLSEIVLREKFPETWKRREYWGSDKIAVDEGEFGAEFRLPLGIGSSVAEAVGFAQSVLKELVVDRSIKYPLSEL